MKKLFFFLIVLFALPVSAHEYVAENGKIIPATAARARYDDILARQEIVRMDFMQEVEFSPFEVDTANFEITVDGFLFNMTPIFSTEFKTPQTQHHVYVFVQGDKELDLYIENGAEALFAKVLKNDEEIVRAVVKEHNVTGKPVLIVLKTRSLLLST